MTINRQPEWLPAAEDQATPEQVERALQTAFELIGELYAILDLAIARGGDSVLDTISHAASDFYGPSHTNPTALADLNERVNQTRRDLQTHYILLDPVTAFTTTHEN